MAKNIVFCADGTWNTPNQDDDADDTPDPTNVYKLFVCLAGKNSPDTLLASNEQEKSLVNHGATLQVAKYIHGVGDSRSPIRRLMGGAFGDIAQFESARPRMSGRESEHEESL